MLKINCCNFSPDENQAFVASGHTAFSREAGAAQARVVLVLGLLLVGWQGGQAWVIHVLGIVLAAQVPVLGLLLVKDKPPCPCRVITRISRRCPCSSPHWMSTKVHLAAQLTWKTTRVEMLHKKTFAFHNFSAQTLQDWPLKSKLSGNYIRESSCRKKNCHRHSFHLFFHY